MVSRSKQAHRLRGSDRIFRLPAEILQRIFFFLPVDDAVSLSATSKTWRNLWTSLPVLNFSYDHDEHDTLEDFVASIEASMQTLRSRSAIIESFFLTINPPENEGLNNLELESHLHDWLSLVMKNYVREIDLRVFESPDINNYNIFYTLPQSVFTSKSLIKLHLIGCKLPTNISFPESRLHEVLCLKEIILEDVVARDDQIQELVNHSRNSLEKLTIKTFDPIEHLSLMIFSKLDFVELNVMTLHIDQALNLDTLILCGIHIVYAFGVRNIKTLKCLTWETNAYKWIKTLISSLPVLETVHLTMIENENIEIKSLCLENFFLCESERLEETIVVEIDAPRLSKIYFTGFSFPAITMLRGSERVELHHLGHSSGGIDGSQLCRLGKFSKNVIHPVLEIHLRRIFVENLLSLEDLKEHPVVYHPTNVAMVVLQCIPAASNYSSFLEALFWTCHPSDLVVLMKNEETLQSPHRASFIRYLVNELMMNRANNPTCCGEPEKPKCWKHYIADVRFQLYKSTRVFEAHELTAGIPIEIAENGAFYPVETNNKGIAIQFRLMWLPYPI